MDGLVETDLAHVEGVVVKVVLGYVVGVAYQIWDISHTVLSAETEDEVDDAVGFQFGALADGLAASVAGETGSLILDRTRNDGLVDVWFVYAPEAKPSVRLGESVALEIRTAATGEAVTAVPSAAIFRDGLQPTVMVRDDEDEDRFVTQAVTPGASANGWTEVKDLAVGTEVVVQGLYELRQALPQAGAAKRVAGHFHADGKFHAGGHDDEE